MQRQILYTLTLVYSASKDAAHLRSCCPESATWRFIHVYFTLRFLEYFVTCYLYMYVSIIRNFSFTETATFWENLNEVTYYSDHHFEA